MNESDETLEQLSDRELLLNLVRELAELRQRFDSFEKTANTQFEAIREGIAYNSAKFDRMEAKIFDARSDISNLRADVKEMTEELRQIKKEQVI